jgi:hypothetical protein
MPCKSYKLESNCARRPDALLAQGEGAELPNSRVILTAQVGEWSAAVRWLLGETDALHYLQVLAVAALLLLSRVCIVSTRTRVACTPVT